MKEQIFDRFFLNVGITGHRSLPPEQIPRIAGHLKQILQTAQEAAKIVSEQGRRDLQIYTEAPVCGLISCLSEGSDRLAARCALDCGYELSATLPFPLGSPVNARDLQGQAQKASRRELAELCAASRTVFQLSPEIPATHQKLSPQIDINDDSDLAADLRQKGYLAASMVMLDRVDILLSIWHGQPQSSEGSTWDCMQRAIKAGIPVLWIHSLNDVPVSLILDEKDIIGPRPCELEHLKEDIVRKYCVPEKEVADLRSSLRDFGVSVETPFLAKSWGKLQKALTNKAVADMPNGPYKEDDNPDFVMFDKAATSFADRHRSAMLGFALKSLLIVVVTALASAWPLDKVKPLVDILSGVTAVFLILAALWYTYAVQKRKWDEKLGLYRCLAEILRLMPFANPVGVYCSMQGINTLYGDTLHDFKQKWYLRNLLRRRGLASGNLADPAYAEEQREEISEYLLLSQICYHKKNSRRCLVISEKIDKLSAWIFWLTLAVMVFQVGINILAYLNIPLPPIINNFIPVTVFVGVMGPVLVTAAQYIRNNLELHRLTIRSEKLAQGLENLRNRLLQDKSPETMRLVMQDSANLMIKDVVDWKEQTVLPKEGI